MRDSFTPTKVTAGLVIFILNLYVLFGDDSSPEHMVQSAASDHVGHKSSVPLYTQGSLPLSSLDHSSGSHGDGWDNIDQLKYASGPSSHRSHSGPRLSTIWTMVFSVGASHYYYSEPSVMSIRAIMPTFTFGFGVVGGGESNFVGGGGKFSFLTYYKGGIGLAGHYNGFLYNLDTSSKTPIRLYSNDYLGEGGFVLRVAMLDRPKTRLDILAGFGNWDLRNKTVSHASYARHQAYSYATLGLSASRVFSTLLIRADGGYRHILRARNISRFSQLGFSNDLVFYGQTGNGYEAAFEIAPIPSSTSSLLVSIRLTHAVWHVEPSETKSAHRSGMVYRFLEPRNSTKMTGFEIRLRM